MRARLETAAHFCKVVVRGLSIPERVAGKVRAKKLQSFAQHLLPLHDSRVMLTPQPSMGESGDTTPCRMMTGVTLHSHVRYQEI